MMNQKIKIGNFEAACLLLNMLASKSILDFPRNAAEEAGTAGWLMTLLVSVTVFLLFLVLSKLYKKFAGRDIIDVGETAFGQIGKIIVGIIFLLQFLVLIPIALRQHAEDIKVISLTKTPISVVIMLFCTGMVIGAYLGLETLARIHVLTVPIQAFAFILIIVLNAPRFELHKLAPWLGLGADVIVKKGIANLSLFSEVIVLFLITPFLHKKNDFGGVGRYSLFFSGLFLVLTSLSYLMVYQYPISTEFFLPVYQMTRSISMGRFFTRIESGFILIWASSAFLYLSSGLYFITYLFQRMFNLKYYKPLIIPFIILIFTMSMVPENLYSTLQIQMDIFRNYSWMITFLIPLLLFTIASFRMRRKKEKEVATE